MLFLAALLVAAPLDLKLMCQGSGEHRVSNDESKVYTGPSGEKLFSSGDSEQAIAFNDRMDIEISGAGGKVRMPRRLLPKAHGGTGGWFQMTDMSVGDDVITARIALNFMNHPRLRIDRRDGSVSIDGSSGSYSGACKPYEPSAGHAF